jgi:hypothetical protein
MTPNVRLLRMFMLLRRNGLNSPIEMDRLDEKQYTSFRGAPKPAPRGKHVMQTKASGELSA